MSAHFLEPEGTGEARIRPYAADFRYILSVENLTGALRTAALNRELRQDIAFSFGIEASVSQPEDIVAVLNFIGRYKRTREVRELFRLTESN